MDRNFQRLLGEFTGATGSSKALEGLQKTFDRALRDEQITEEQHRYLSDRLSERLKSVPAEPTRKPFEEGKPEPTEPQWLGKPISYWEQIADSLRKGTISAKLRLSIANSLKVSNEPAKILQTLNRRIAEIKQRGAQPAKISFAAYLPEGATTPEVGPNHPEILKRLGIKGFETPERRNTPQFGFTDETGQFLTREQAAERAKLTGQNLKDFEPDEPAHSDEIASPTEPGKAVSEQTPTEKPLELMTAAEYDAWENTHYAGQAYVPWSEDTGGGSLHGQAAAAYQAIKEGKPVSDDARAALQDAIAGNKAHIEVLRQHQQQWDARDPRTRVELPSDQWEKLWATYFADKPNPSKSFPFKGGQWVSTGGEYGVDRDIANAYRLVPEADFKGKVYASKDELYKLWDEGKGERGDETGLRVKLRGKPFILADRTAFVRRKGRPPGAPPPPEAPAPTEPAKPISEQSTESEKKPTTEIGTGGPLIGMGGAVPSEFGTQANPDIYGIAHRVREQRAAAGQVVAVPRGEGMSPEETIERGRQLHAQGMDPESTLAEFERTKAVSADAIALIRYQGEVLSRLARRAEEKFGTQSPEFETAWRALSNWDTRSKPMQTEWHKIGQAQQGQTDIDTGSFTGLQRAYHEATGRDFTPQQAAQAEKVAKDVTETQQAAETAKQTVINALDEALTKEKVPQVTTIGETQKQLGDMSTGTALTPGQRATIWSYIKNTYLARGETNLDAIAQGAADDLGLPKATVMKVLAEPKTAKRLTDDMYLKMSRSRQAVQSAKTWLANTAMPGWERFIRSIPRLFFSAKVFGHGTVGLITHGGPEMFDPDAASVYWPNFLRQYRLMFSEAYHERMMQQLMHDRYFITARRAGLANDPFRYQDDYQNPKLTLWLHRWGLMGNRGFDALKLLRQARFNQIWDSLGDNMKTPEMAQQIANGVNHATGIVRSGALGKLAEPAAVAFFAPKLEASRWAFAIGDPAKAAATFASWDRATPEARTQAMSELKQKARIAGTYLGLLALNQGLLAASGSRQRVNFTNPRRGDFLTFKAAGQDIGIISPLLHMVGLFANLYRTATAKRKPPESLTPRGEEMGQEIWQYARGKLSPFASPIVDLLAQSDYQGRPLPFSSDRMPTYLRKRGVQKWTWPEYAVDKLAPIPAEEAIREVWKSQGMNDDQVDKYLRALAVFVVAGGTGARLNEDRYLQPAK